MAKSNSYIKGEKQNSLQPNYGHRRDTELFKDILKKIDVLSRTTIFQSE